MSRLPRRGVPVFLIPVARLHHAEDVFAPGTLSPEARLPDESGLESRGGDADMNEAVPHDNLGRSRHALVFRKHLLRHARLPIESTP